MDFEYRMRLDQSQGDDTMKAQFDRIAEQENVSAHDRLVEMVRSYKLEHPNESPQAAFMACATAYPKLHKEYLDANGSY